jgi:hypothetical protein
MTHCIDTPVYAEEPARALPAGYGIRVEARIGELPHRDDSMLSTREPRNRLIPGDFRSHSD